MHPSEPVLRPATPGDRPFLLALLTRLAAFPLPPWRTADEVAAADRPILLAALDQLSSTNGERGSDTLIMVAEDPRGTPAGYVMVTTGVDYFSRERHAYVEILAVTEAAVGRGLGRALMQGAEAWARRQGYAQIALNVLATNQTARGMYEHLGFQPETVRYRKAL